VGVGVSISLSGCPNSTMAWLRILTSPLGYDLLSVLHFRD
jgi:hypothetical protein